MALKQVELKSTSMVLMNQTLQTVDTGSLHKITMVKLMERVFQSNKQREIPTI